jgi:hypothetical protein
LLPPLPGTQYKTDQDGANIGVTPFDNCVRPQQYSKPGGGIGGGTGTSVL